MFLVPKKLNWTPIYNVDQSLEKTIEWYNKVINNKADPLQITNNQITDYMKACKWL